MKPTAIIAVAALGLAVAPLAATAQTSDPPAQNVKPHEEQGGEHGGAGHEGCCKMMHEMHEQMMDHMKSMHQGQGEHGGDHGGDHGGGGHEGAPKAE